MKNLNIVKSNHSIMCIQLWCITLERRVADGDHNWGELMNWWGQETERLLMQRLTLHVKHAVGRSSFSRHNVIIWECMALDGQFLHYFFNARMRLAIRCVRFGSKKHIRTRQRRIRGLRTVHALPTDGSHLTVRMLAILRECKFMHGGCHSKKACR